MSENKAGYETMPKNLNELKDTIEGRGIQWNDALEQLKKATGGKSVSQAMKEGWTVEDFYKRLTGDETPSPPDDSPQLDTNEEHNFTEAPASFNVKAYSPQGFDIMLTLRDADTGALLKRANSALEWMLKHGYSPTRRSGNGGNSGQQDNGGEPPLCPTHNKPMKASKHGGWFCTAKIADDDGTGKPVYCKQKA